MTYSCHKFRTTAYIHILALFRLWQNVIDPLCTKCLCMILCFYINNGEIYDTISSMDYQVNKVYFQNKTKMKYIWLTIQKRVSITRCLERWFLSQVLVLRAQFNFLCHTYAVHQCYRILYCSQGTLKFVFRHNNSLNIYKVHTSCTLIFRHFLFKGKMLFKENLISS